MDFLTCPCGYRSLCLWSVFQAQTPVPADTSEIKADKEMSLAAKETPTTDTQRSLRPTDCGRPALWVHHVIYAINYCFDIHTDRTSLSLRMRNENYINLRFLPLELSSSTDGHRNPPTVTVTDCLTARCTHCRVPLKNCKIPSECTSMNLQAIFNWESFPIQLQYGNHNF